ncbi:BrxA/BrxB family bacilliredoxin, partial [Longimicrobium sp.]|uniref:BrxA/BrxB family bacilliredoxin n=1 Tax=Longimicrobium sp. TaxID=2029185 RepID=UPI0032C23957
MMFRGCRTRAARPKKVPPRDEPIRPGRMPKMYPEMMIAPMRQELTRLGVQELKTPDEVQATLSDTSEPTLLVVNSMCG